MELLRLSIFHCQYVYIHMAVTIDVINSSKNSKSVDSRCVPFKNVRTPQLKLDSVDGVTEFSVKNGLEISSSLPIGRVYGRRQIG
jgi:hypothetical protein